jgi:hypothetical protein
MDPWNGSGTTTSAATALGHAAVGFDVNPVMTVVAKARLLPQSELTSIDPLLTDILKKAKSEIGKPDGEDPLEIWFLPEAAITFRGIERATYRLLISAKLSAPAFNTPHQMSSLAAFFYVALFRAVRSLLHPFEGSNPTWITRPRTLNRRLRPAASTVKECFSEHVRRMLLSAACSGTEPELQAANPTIAVASSENLPVRPGTVDFVLSSPPYCTRIDYGVATLPELAVIGFEVDKRLRELRSRLIGTPTIHSRTPEPVESWGDTCVRLLERIRSHRSKAATSYYYKTYVQYFAAMSRSFSEVGRCLRRRGQCVLVVQDSHFKDVHVDLAKIFADMGRAASLQLRHRVDFPINRTFGSINLRSRRYRAASSATESVLCFAKDA